MNRVYEVGEGIWAVDHEAKMAPAAYLPLRMTILRVGGALMLHSPVPMDDALVEEIDQLGEVAHIVGPNKFHHLHIPEAKRRYPKAAVWGAPGLAKKRSDIAFDGVLGSGSPEAWREELVHVHVQGVPMVNEVVTYHRPSRSLVVTDLVFNMKQTRGWATRVVMALVGASKGFAHSRSWKYIFVRDKGLAGRGVAEILSLDFDRIVPAHGDIAEDSRQRLVDQLRYLSPPSLTA